MAEYVLVWVVRIRTRTTEYNSVNGVMCSSRAEAEHIREFLESINPSVRVRIFRKLRENDRFVEYSILPSSEDFQNIIEA